MTGRIVANRRNDEDITCPCRGDISQANPFREITRALFGRVIDNILRRPPGETDGAEAVFRVEQANRYAVMVRWTVIGCLSALLMFTLGVIVGWGYLPHHR